MGCWERFVNWINFKNIPFSEQSILRDLHTIGVADNVGV